VGMVRGALVSRTGAVLKGFAGGVGWWGGSRGGDVGEGEGGRDTRLGGIKLSAGPEPKAQRPQLRNHLSPDWMLLDHCGTFRKHFPECSIGPMAALPGSARQAY